MAEKAESIKKKCGDIIYQISAYSDNKAKDTLDKKIEKLIIKDLSRAIKCET